MLLGAGSLTPQGLSGAIVLGHDAGVLACGVFLLLASVALERTGTTDTRKLGGLAKLMPAWTIVLSAAGLAQAGVLGLGGAWGPLLALLGVLSSYAPLAVVAAGALVVLAGERTRPHPHALASGKLDAEPSCEGRPVADLSRQVWASVGPLALFVILLGLWPAPVVTVTTGTVRDIANAVSPPGPDQVAAN